jgi:thiol-disulfide isomerase/thioredoxin
MTRASHLLLFLVLSLFTGAAASAQNEEPANQVAEPVNQVAEPVNQVAEPENQVAEPAKPRDEKAAEPVIRTIRIGADFGATESGVGESGAADRDANTASSDVPAAPGVISLINGNTIAGDLGETESPDVIRWQGADFTEPFVIVSDAIKSIKFPRAEERVAQTGPFALETVGGDLLSGRLVRWTPEIIQVKTELFGDVSMHANSLRRIYRIEENPTLVFASLAGLQDWTLTEAGKDQWKEDGAHLWTDKPGAMISGDLGVPNKAMIEFKISWIDKPDFIFAVGVDADSETDRRTDGWRFEVIGDTLALIREDQDVADVAMVQVLKGDKSVRLIAYLDQNLGEMHVLRPGGELLARISLPAALSKVGDTDDAPDRFGRGVRLIHRDGGVRLERLRISRWSGNLPTANAEGIVNVRLIDGTTLSGETVRMKRQDKSLVVSSGATQSTALLKDVVAVKLMPAKGQSVDFQSTLFLHDGTRVSGIVEAVTADEWIIRSTEFTDPVKVPRHLARTFLVMRRDPVDAAPGNAGRSGRLEIGTHKLTGRLVPAVEQQAAGESSLRWHPFGSLTSSPLLLDAGGRIVYRDPPPKVDPVTRRTTEQALQMQRARLQQQKRGLNFGQLFLRKADDNPAARQVGPDAHRVHVRSGDVIPCLVDSIDESGVHVLTNLAEDALIPHHRVKAIQLAPNAAPPSLQEAKKQRLLTLPRLQKTSPPTHLLCSANGDFLRCRLLELRDQTIRVELQLDEIEIPRDRVSQIIWLHPDELTGGDQDPEAASAESPFQRMAQVVKRDGKRVTFDPRQVNDKQISGVSDVLGACQFEIGEIDQLIFGEAIREAVSVLPYNQWQLQPAVEPLMARDSAGGGAEVGSESALIGTDAPEIKLDLLSGDQFLLSQCRGQIVVLDFWATWCAPCMQTMPLVEEAMSQFDSDQVRLVSVNLEESAEHIESVLQRHDMNLTVALDIDGVAAARYQARAIPQMVIVDQEGKVARLYVGGGSRMVEELTAAITELLQP